VTGHVQDARAAWRTWTASAAAGLDGVGAYSGAQIFRPAAKRSCEHFAAGLSRCFAEAPRRSRRLGEFTPAARGCRLVRRAQPHGLVEKSYFLDFFEAFLAVFFVLFLAVFFLAAM
jgi:hypothetical protein